MAIDTGNISGYTEGGVGPAAGITPSTVDSADGEYWSLAKVKRAYTDYLGSKQQEIKEQQQSRRYRHADHWTNEQIIALNKRKQPVVTYNLIGRKIDGIVGLVEKLRQDPKAYPRTPKHEQGAELATAALRYVLDEAEWKAKSPLVAEFAAIDGLAGIELELVEGDHGDREIDFDVVDNDGFFYDPRSIRHDFTDARFMGMGKWLDLEAAKELFPDQADDIEASVERGSELSSQSDRDNKFFHSVGDFKRIRLVDIWYKCKGEWLWCCFTGALKLMEGKSYLLDEKGKTECKYVMFSAGVDHDGDRYGFVRNLKSANDEVNQRRSKGLHELNTRRIMAEEGAFKDIEKARVEAARPDGIVIRNPGTQAEFDDAARIANIEGQLKFLEDARTQIENFGPNPAVLGQGVENSSGRAIALLQQAGIAELGPYIMGYRGWKIRVYRAIWNAVQRNWSGERWIRVTDDEGIAQFIQVNHLGIDPHTGMPTIINQIGSLDVDIVLDEGPDQVNMMGDAYDTLSILASKGAMVPPEVLIELSPLAGSVKKRVLDMLEKSKQNPAAQQAQQVAIAGEAAKVDETKSQTMLNIARAQNEGMPEQAAPGPQPEFQLPPQLQVAKGLADIQETQASAMHKRAQAAKIETDRTLAPLEMMQDAAEAHAGRMERVAFKGADLRQQGEDRRIAARKPNGGQ